MGGRTAVATADQHAYQVALASEQGRFQAGWLANRLGAGEPPPLAAGRSPNGEPVWLNAMCHLFSWGVVDVVPDQRRVVAFGPPLFVSAAVALGESANRRERRRAEALSGPQWRSHGRVQVLVSPSATWLLQGSEWRSYPHTSVTCYELVDGGCTMRFAGGFPPVRLVGPAVFVHAVLLAYAQYGPGRSFLRAPYLLPLQHGASALPVPVA
jgi:hypothetical protein